MIGVGGSTMDKSKPSELSLGESNTTKQISKARHRQVQANDQENVETTIRDTQSVGVWGAKNHPSEYPIGCSIQDIFFPNQKGA